MNEIHPPADWPYPARDPLAPRRHPGYVPPREPQRPDPDAGPEEIYSRDHRERTDRHERTHRDVLLGRERSFKD